MQLRAEQKKKEKKIFFCLSLFLSLPFIFVLLHHFFKSGAYQYHPSPHTQPCHPHICSFFKILKVDRLTLNFTL